MPGKVPGWEPRRGAIPGMMGAISGMMGAVPGLLPWLPGVPRAPWLGAHPGAAAQVAPRKVLVPREAVFQLLQLSL